MQRIPGQSLERWIKSELLDAYLPYLLVSLVFFSIGSWEVIRWAFSVKDPAYFFMFLAIGTIIYSAFQMRKIERSIKRKRLGLDGEQAVGQYLDRIVRSNSVIVFHDITFENFNIDHVIISQKGIFAIETKTRSVPVNGNAVVRVSDEGVRLNGGKPYSKCLKQARSQACALKELLQEKTNKSRFVRAVVLLPGWTVAENITSKYSDTWVLGPKQFREELDAERDRLTREDVTELSKALRSYLKSAREG